MRASSTQAEAAVADTTQSPGPMERLDAGPVERLDAPTAWLLFSAGAAAALALILWNGRDTTFSVDELVLFMTSPGQDIAGALEPANGHLGFVTSVVYHLMLEAFGGQYLPFRLLAAASVVVTSALFFAYAARRIGRAAALAPAAVLLYFGSDYLHVIAGNGFTILLALSCGLGALLALDRGDRAGDLLASGLLCLGVFTYTVALAFVVGVAVSVLARADRWRRVWIVAAPTVLYGAWWLWALSQPNSAGDQLTLSNLLLLPAWGYQSLGSTLGAIVGLDYDFAGSSSQFLAQTSTTVPFAGPVLAVVAIGLFVWRARSTSVGWAAWSALGVLIVLWMLGVVAAGQYRPPTSIRYLYPSAIAVLLLAAETAAGSRWRRESLIALYLVAAVGLAANVAQLRDGGELRRDSEAPKMRAELGALQIAGQQANTYLNVGLVADGPSVLTYPFGIVKLEAPASVLYLAAADRYGPVGFSPDELRAQSEELRARADSFLSVALSVAALPADPAERVGRCRVLSGSPDRPISFTLPRRGAVIRALDAAGELQIRRFADNTLIDLGPIAPHRPESLQIPLDNASDPWRVQVAGTSARICAAT